MSGFPCTFNWMTRPCGVPAQGDGAYHGMEALPLDEGADVQL